MEIAAVKEGPHSLITELECTDEKEWGALSAGRTRESLFCSTLGQQIYKTKPERLTLRKVPGIDIPGGVRETTETVYELNSVTLTMEPAAFFVKVLHERSYFGSS